MVDSTRSPPGFNFTKFLEDVFPPAKTLREIEHKVDKLNTKLSTKFQTLQEKLVTQLSDLQDAIAQIGTDLGELADRIEAKIPAEVDLSAETNALRSLSTQIDALESDDSTPTPDPDPAPPVEPDPNA